MIIVMNTGRLIEISERTTVSSTPLHEPRIRRPGNQSALRIFVLIDRRRVLDHDLTPG